MDFSAVVLTEDQQAFADELRALLDEHLAGDRQAHRRENAGGFDEQLYLALGRKGWLWPQWRREDGGAGRASAAFKYSLQQRQDIWSSPRQCRTDRHKHREGGGCAGYSPCSG